MTIRVGPVPAVRALPFALPGWAMSADGAVLVNSAPHAATTVRRLSDLLAPHPTAHGKPAAYLADPSATRALQARGHDPIMYEAHRDILAPRTPVDTTMTGTWYADLVVYHPGTLPGGEPHRSLGHWNAPAQLEIFQVLAGRVLMLTASHTPRGRPSAFFQVCEPGTLAVIPWGAWHHTLVLDGPAAVFNTYTDLHQLQRCHSSRDAALNPELKYRSQPPAEITAVTDHRGFRIISSQRAAATWGPLSEAQDPLWMGAILGDSLATFHGNADGAAIDNLARNAVRHLTRSFPSA